MLTDSGEDCKCRSDVDPADVGCDCDCNCDSKVESDCNEWEEGSGKVFFPRPFSPAESPKRKFGVCFGP